jgi:aerobic-type carbon monoxide dehydrogenase small subunit (CoxS/CutS family)
MSEGGFLVKFDGKEVARCFTVAFDYDERQYTINDTEKKELPLVRKITIEVEEG